jgi:hypothetical protein
MKRDTFVFSLGVVALIIWLADLANILFFVQKPEFILWYSVMGLLLTAIALLTQNPVLVSTMFCALFVMESAYSLDFLGRVFFHKNFLGIAAYVFEPTYPKKDFYMALYHFLIPFALLAAQIRIKRVYRFSWIWASFYTLIIVSLTLLLVGGSGTVNCVHQLTFCRGAFSFILYKFPYPHRIFIALFAIIFLIFIPTQYALLRIGKKLRWKVV